MSHFLVHSPAFAIDQTCFTQIDALIDQFAPISLAEMDAVALLNRIDTKYMLTPEQLLRVLGGLCDEYRVLSVNGVRLNHYYTLYFDTPAFTLYHHHHNGGQNRYKVRLRSYVESQLAFLEVKLKNNKGRTVKSRLRIADLIPQLDQHMQTFLQVALPFDSSLLEPKLWNRFVRITLVSKTQVERLTLDLDLSFGAADASSHFPQLAIAEVKQDGVSRQSHFVQQMRSLHVSQLSFSKYCIGAALHYPHLKQNNFKPVFLHMHKLGAGALSGTIQ